MSNANVEKSGGMSRDITMFIVSTHDEVTNADADTLKYHETEEFIEEANHVFRKLCHFGEYLVLSILFFLFIYSFNKIKILLCYLYSMVFSVIYAILDEYHQSFVDGRGSEIRDILIDTCGALFGIIIIYFIYTFNKKRRIIKNSTCIY